MDLISQHKVFHGGTYNTNPVSMAAGLATFREVLTRDNYAHVDKLGKKLADGYRKIDRESLDCRPTSRRLEPTAR
jgi:glutamate-1-semialdehyde 2,1-aminomutase